MQLGCGLLARTGWCRSDQSRRAFTRIVFALAAPPSLSLSRAATTPHAQVSLTWSGPRVGAVKRARALQARSSMRSKLGPVSVEIEAASADDVTLQAVRGRWWR
jgi:hypothetical protein